MFAALAGTRDPILGKTHSRSPKASLFSGRGGLSGTSRGERDKTLTCDDLGQRETSVADLVDLPLGFRLWIVSNDCVLLFDQSSRLQINF